MLSIYLSLTIKQKNSISVFNKIDLLNNNFTILDLNPSKYKAEEYKKHKNIKSIQQNYKQKLQKKTQNHKTCDINININGFNQLCK